MTEEEREAESKAVWEKLETEPGFRASMRRGTEDFEHGRYFSMEVGDQRDRIPKLKVVKKSEASRRWEEYERRIPGLKGRLIQARRDLEEGKGFVLLENGTTIPFQEYMAQQAASKANEQVLIDNTPVVNPGLTQE